MKESEHGLKIPPDDNHKSIQYTPRPVAEVVELVDTTDSKRSFQRIKLLFLMVFPL